MNVEQIPETIVEPTERVDEVHPHLEQFPDAIQDPIKAEHMARAGYSNRAAAASERKFTDSSWESARNATGITEEELLKTASVYDKRADRLENKAAKIYDKAKGNIDATTSSKLDALDTSKILPFWPGEANPYEHQGETKVLRKIGRSAVDFVRVMAEDAGRVPQVKPGQTRNAPKQTATEPWNRPHTMWSGR